MHTRGRFWLTAAAAASFGVAALHVAITFVGTPAYDYFGAPATLVSASRRGSAVPALITLVIALVFAAFGLVGLSAADRAPRLPLLRIVLVGISGVYTLRGLTVVPELLLFLNASTLPAGIPVPLRMLVFSLVSLAIGILYIVGTARRWSALDAVDGL